MSQCYLCAGAVGADGAAVCGTCVKKQLGPTVRATAEFHVPSVAFDEAGNAAPVVSSTAGCTWCGKEGGAVKKLLGNGAVAICNECVALCADVMEAELGSSWRG